MSPSRKSAKPEPVLATRVPGLLTCRSGVSLEDEIAARLLIAQLVKGYPVVLETEIHRMLALHPAEVIVD